MEENKDPKKQPTSFNSNNQFVPKEDDRYQQFIHLSSEGIWRFGFAGTEPLDITLPVEEQIDEIFERAILDECNDAMARMYGLESSKQLEGKRLKELLVRSKPENIEYLKAFIRSGYRLANAESIETDHKGDIKYFLNNLAGIIKDGKLLGAWGSQRDITDLKKASEALINMNVQLTQKNEELSRTNNELDNFIYTVSHDLIAPLNNIEGLINVLKIGESYQHEESKMMIDLMEVAVNKFKATIKNIAEIPKSRRQKETSDEANFSEVFENIKLFIGDLIRDTEAEFKAEFLCAGISLNKTSVQSVMYNLISNSLKYRHPDRKPVIEVCTKKVDNFTLLEVKDNGIGFSPEKGSDIFDLFKRLHHHVEGSGLGLYIVKRIAENSGGKVEVTTVPGNGAEFKVYFGNA